MKFQQATLVMIPDDKLRAMWEAAPQEQLRQFGGDVSFRAFKEAVRAELTKTPVFKSEEYQVAVFADDSPADGWPPMIHLSIKRIDKQPIHDWRDLQEIKNALVGPEHEAVELYPAESRVVDSANQYHLWVLADPAERFPFGFTERYVSYDSVGGSVQRPNGDDDGKAN